MIICLQVGQCGNQISSTAKTAHAHIQVRSCKKRTCKSSLIQKYENIEKHTEADWIPLLGGRLRRAQARQEGTREAEIRPGGVGFFKIFPVRNFSMLHHFLNLNKRA